MNPLEKVEAVSFGCLGTLVDWEAEVRRAIGHLAAEYGLEEPVEHLLAEWRSVQDALTAGPWRTHGQILRDSLDETFCRYCVRLHAEEADMLSARLGACRLTDDATAALRRLQGRYRLVVVSDADSESVAAVVEASGLAIDEVVTADQMRLCKPDPDLFREVLRRLDIPAERVLHCAGDVARDLVPAHSLGLATAWLHRAGAPSVGPFTPTLRVDSLGQLADQLLGGK